jgi:eukaryotic-like serine/threonine-protein kinase
MVGKIPSDKSIFFHALDISNPVERATFVKEACGAHQTLQAQVNGLLESHDKPHRLLDAAPLAMMPLEPKVMAGPGKIIGPYKLVAQIGEGGMGVVFLAEQLQPVERQVALKIIKPGMDSAQVLARFDTERQALAMMDHPNIAKVLDAGTIGDSQTHDPDSQRPYFVMELIKGVPITEFCDKNHLAPEKRLALFLSVCHAIQHAHQKGVIHRDIKPTNVLVTQSESAQLGKDATPLYHPNSFLLPLTKGEPGAVVKVIDFGVAKAIAQKLTDQTPVTVWGQMIGTPAYMSPEQAERNSLDIDTRSDIYALGVLLYELLTGTTPLDDKRLRSAGYADMQRMIREEEPPRPSARLSSLGAKATTLAGNRATDPKQLTRLLAGDLDWIVMKALEKDRDRRYATPEGLADDVERYLRHDAILARPPSRLYKVKKFARRNRTVVLATIAVASALLLGTFVAIWQAIVATRAQADAVAAARSERKARNKAVQAEEDALAAAAVAKKAQKTAEAREAQARALFEFLEKHVLAAARPEGQEGGLGPDVTLRQAIAAALQVIDKSFAGQPLIEAKLRMTVGDSFLYLGDPSAAAEQFGKARALYTTNVGAKHPDTLRSMNNLANSYADLGRRADALKLRQETLELCRNELGAEHADTLGSMYNLANSFSDAGRHDDALKMHDQVLLIRQERLGADDPETLASLHAVAVCYASLGRHAEAAKLSEQTLALHQAKLGLDHPHTLSSMNNLAQNYADLGRFDDASALHEKTLALMKVKLGTDHPITLTCMHNLAICYAGLGRHADALVIHEQTLAARRTKLGSNHPDALSAMYDLANDYFAVGRHADALKLYKETLALANDMFGPDYKISLLSMRGCAVALMALGRGAEAVPIIDDCLEQATGKNIHPRLLPSLVILRFRYFERAKDAAGCRTTARLWEKLQRTDADSLYDAACFRAITAAAILAAGKSAEDVRAAEAEGDQAIAWLQKAVAEGYKNVAHMKEHRDLEILHSREDYRRLIREMEAVN